MPASRSPSRRAEPAARSHSYWPIVLIGLAAVLAVIIAVLPASIASHFLPPPVHAEDFSGSIWHGSAGKLSVAGRDAGALEWRLHPAALLGMRAAVDVHWVKGGFVVDAGLDMDRHGYAARNVKGGGPIEDLRDVGVAAGWRGTALIDFNEIKGDFTRPSSAAGILRIANLASAQVAEGTDLGSYEVQLAQGAVAADGTVNAQLVDTGGPLELQAQIRYAPAARTGTLTGTLKERPDASPALRNQLQNLAQLHGRDAQGRIPVDFEVAL
jgi:hypothetical protein